MLEAFGTYTSHKYRLHRGFLAATGIGFVCVIVTVQMFR